MISYEFLVHFWLLGVLSVYLVSVAYSAFIVPKALDNGPPAEDYTHKLTRALGALFYIIFPKGLIDHPGMVFSSWYGLYHCIEYHKSVLFHANNSKKEKQDLDTLEVNEAVDDLTEELKLRVTIAVVGGMRTEGSDTDKMNAVIDNVIKIFIVKHKPDVEENTDYH